MFTDTKNLANLTANTASAATKQINTHSQDEDKFKLKKMWKPILRLMSRKSSLTKNDKRDSKATIPNNVNLNNASQSVSTEKNTSSTLDDSSCLAHKLPLAKFCSSQQQQTLQQQDLTEPLEFISKASIDKTPLDSCTSCVYGPNCQHTMDVNINNSHPHTHVHPHHSQQNFNYFDAEDGCFVWFDNTEDLDENALREWLWQNSWQFAENATMC